MKRVITLVNDNVLDTCILHMFYLGCVGTHAVSGIWGILAAGLFLRKDETLNAKYLSRASPGLFYVRRHSTQWPLPCSLRDKHLQTQLRKKSWLF